jgi:AAA+ ATPase superfamily predicted ATPase
MIGRQADVREIGLALENGTSLVVAGPRRTGKTSVCDAALLRARADGFYVAAVDLFKLADAAEFAEVLASAVLSNRPAAHKLVARARKVGRSALDAAQGAAALKLRDQLGDGVEIALTPGFAARDPAKALVSALELPQRVAQADGKRIIVFFDEFQEVANARHPFGHPDQVTKQMRAVFQRSSEVSYLFAGSLEHVMRDLFGPQSRALSGFGSFHDLRPITDEDWAAGLRERFEGDGCTVDEDALSSLIEFGELHPRVTMLIAQKAHFLTVLLDQRHVSMDIVTQAYDLAYTGDRALLDQLIDTIRSTHRQSLTVARRIAHGGKLTGGAHAGDIDRARTKLQDAGIIERIGHGQYRIANPLLRRHLIESEPI